MTKPDIMEEAADPNTDPERLQELVRMNFELIRRTALKNPSLPESTWWSHLRYPEAWDNPMAVLYLIKEIDESKLFSKAYDARKSCIQLMSDPNRASENAKTLLDSVILEWWDISTSPYDMLEYLGNWASGKRFCEEPHRKVVGILRMIFQRALVGGMNKEAEVLSLMEEFSEGNCNKTILQKLSKEELPISYKEAILYTLDNMENPSHSIRALIQELADKAADHGGSYSEAAQRYKEKFAGIIRREMPTPPLASTSMV